MATESVIWTVLPNGRDRDNPDLLKATIFVSPRLTTNGSAFLKDFPTFSRWPDALTELKFLVEIDRPGGIVAVDCELDGRVAKPDPATWSLLFGDQVGVVDHEFRDLSDRRIRSFAANSVANDVLGLYTQVAADHPFGFPPVTTGPLAQWADDIGPLGDQRDDLYKRLDAMFDGEQSGIVEGRRGRYLPRSAVAGNRRLTFAQVYRFYDRFLNGETARPKPGKIDSTQVPPPPDPPKYDFHAYLGSLGDYPHLERLLGVAIDVVFKADPSFDGDHRLRIQLAGNPQPWMTVDTARPWLAYELGKHFLPRSRFKRRDFVDGQLHLRSDFYAVHQIDIDGSAMKMLNTAATAWSVKRHLTLTTPSMTADSSSLPALRSTGFTVVRNDRAAQIVEQFDHAHLHDRDVTQNNASAELFAEDVTRGYRVDAETNMSGRFRSLCERDGSYLMQTANGPVTLPIPPRDEGYVKSGSTSSVPGDGAGKAELYLHEAVLSWGGWSLVAARPGKYVDTEEQIQDPPPAPEVDPGLPLVTSFRAAPGSLPRLRYGLPYRLRARLVDLAGNSVPTDEIDDAQASAKETFFRWEPVGSPAVTPRRGYGEGESQLRMVIRSTFGVDVGSYVALPRIVSLGGHNTADTAYLADDNRWIAAPKTSQQMAEFHGAFDDAIGTGVGIDEAFAVAAKESGVLPDTVPADALELPYLPDVSARGIALTSLPNDPQSAPTRTLAWPSNAVDGGAAAAPWWDRQPIRIRVVEGPAAAPVTPAGAVLSPAFDPATRVLTVFVPQAELVTIRLSSFLADADLDIQGMWDRIRGLVPANRRVAALAGRVWMFTPWSELTFVHAVEKPLLEPVVDVTASGMQRSLGETFCVLAGSIDNHAKSTGRLDVEAAWTEQVDDLSRPTPQDGVNGADPRPCHAHVGDFSLEADEDDCLVGRDDVRPFAGKPAIHRLRHEFGDTRHRLVGYHARATTRFREYFPPSIVEGVDPDTGERYVVRTGPTVQRHVPSSRRPDPPDIAYVIPTFNWTQTVTRARPPGGPGGLVAQLASTTTRTRRTGGLRVYLRRGWYSSGDGELLGVVLANQPWITWPFDAKVGLEVSDAVRLQAEGVAKRVLDRRLLARVTDAGSFAEQLVAAAGIGDADVAAGGAVAMRRLAGNLATVDLGLGPIIAQLLGGIDPDKLVTHWGRDPLWGSVNPAAGPYIHQFPLRSAVRTDLSLAETTKAKVAVVGHTPRFDPDRGLWYCDIELEAGASYTPFVRLALARYQPHSIENAHLSRVVRTDFMQLLPQRAASFTPRGATVSVSVRGPAGYTELAQRLTAQPTSVTGVNASRRLSAQIQRLPAGGDPDLGWTDVGDEVTLVAGLSDAGLAAVNWIAPVPVPAAPAGAQQRVLVREWELLQTDADPEDPFDAVRELVFGPVEFRSVENIRERLVYADTFVL